MANRAINLVISYSDIDITARRALEMHLTSLMRQDLIAVWHNHMIPAGEELRGETDRIISAADIILLLLSPDFLASDVLFNQDVRRAMEQHAAGISRVIPVLARPIDWSGLPFSGLESVPKGGLAVSRWPDQDEAWLSVVESIRQVIAELAAREAGIRVRVSVMKGPDTGRTFIFSERDRLLVGRAKDATFCISDSQLSRHQFMIEVNPPDVRIEDLGSSNGTFLNEGSERVRTAVLRSGDVIKAGETTFKIEVVYPAALTVPALKQEEQPTSLPTIPRGSDTPIVRVPVRCLRCGKKSASHEIQSREDRVAFFCENCQQALLSSPPLPSGYQAIRELGRGSMGVVYLVRHNVLGVNRAAKVVLPKVAVNERSRRLFIREATEQARIAHPRIVEVYDFQEVKPGIFCMVMEYVDGQSAEELLKTSSSMKMGRQEAIAIVGQGLEALEFAHQQGIVHRDVKDANLLVTRYTGGLSVKLSDFGLAKAYETSGASGFTSTGETAGTINYMAPEQFLDYRRVRPAADLYSMGVVLYRLLTGAFPLEIPPGSNPLTAVLEQPAIPLQKKDPTIPVRLAQAVERALRKDPEQRFVSAEAMRQAILSAT